MSKSMDKELQMYRDLMAVPDQYEEGFGWKTVIGAVFIGFLMVPGSIYLSLFLGGGLGGAAQWVTVILFSEIVKRSMKTLKQQEIFVLFYMTGISLSMPFPLLWNQYFAQSPEAASYGIASEIPAWFAPKKEILEQSQRTFLTAHWAVPLLFMIGMLILQRIDHFGLGYALYRLTAHVEKLPFPMAPMSALGVTALAESRDPKERWRWRCFSLGAVMGLGFGLIYAGLPAVTQALFGKAIKILPIPWLDLTPQLSTPDFLPAVPINLVFDASLFILGMVIPFWAVVGGFIGLIITFIMNPLLYKAGILKTWTPGMGVVDTSFSNHLDFYLSFGIGLMAAIFIVSLIPVFKSVKAAFSKRAPGVEQGMSFWEMMTNVNKERGDLSILTAMGIYVVSTCVYLGLCMWMMPGTPEANYQDRFPLFFFMGFAFIYQPIISYTNAKLAGLVGQSVQIPLVREAAYILSGFKGAQIWFAPIPLSDYGSSANSFRTLELTGTRLGSIIKTEIIVFPILVISTIMFSELIWRMAPVPSEAYPFTQEVWKLQALNQALTITSTTAGTSPFLEAVNPSYIGAGFIAGTVSFAVLTFMNLPTFLVYGVVRGLGQTTPGAILPEIIGALIARYYFEKIYGKENFKKYIMIILAGFSAGVGLIGMAAVAIALIAKSTTTVGY